jgi:hypothetical protein
MEDKGGVDRSPGPHLDTFRGGSGKPGYRCRLEYLRLKMLTRRGCCCPKKASANGSG